MVTAGLQPITATAGETIVRQGGPADKFLILLEGEAEVIREVDGQTESVSPLKPGTLYGEVAIMLTCPGRPASRRGPTSSSSPSRRKTSASSWRGRSACRSTSTRSSAVASTSSPAPSGYPDRARFGSKEFRSTVGSFATGVTVITTRGEQHPYGMTANAFSSRLSLDPPLILVCVMSRWRGWQLDHGQPLLCREHPGGRPGAAVSVLCLARPAEGPNDAFLEVPHRTAETGSPILDGAIGYLDCNLHAQYESGDDHIFIGEVLDIGYDPEVRRRCSSTAAATATFTTSRSCGSATDPYSSERIAAGQRPSIEAMRTRCISLVPE